MSELASSTVCCGTCGMTARALLPPGWRADVWTCTNCWHPPELPSMLLVAIVKHMRGCSSPCTCFDHLEHLL